MKMDIEEDVPRMGSLFTNTRADFNRDIFLTNRVPDGSDYMS
jgi:hypothetical protein